MLAYMSLNSYVIGIIGLFFVFWEITKYPKSINRTIRHLEYTCTLSKKYIDKIMNPQKCFNNRHRQ